MASFDPTFRYQLSTSLFQHLRNSFHQIYQFGDANFSQSIRYVLTETALDLDKLNLGHIDYFSLVVSDEFGALLIAQRTGQHTGQHTGQRSQSAHAQQALAHRLSQPLNPWGPAQEKYAVDLLEGEAVAQFVDWLAEQLPPGSDQVPAIQQMRRALCASPAPSQSLLGRLLLESLSQLEQPDPGSPLASHQVGTAAYSSALRPVLSRPSQLAREPQGATENRDRPTAPAPMPASAPQLAHNPLSPSLAAAGPPHWVDPEHEKVERAKKGFLAAVNHELRTPLTYILGMSTTLLRWIDDGAEAALKQQQRHYLESIYNQGKHLLEMINGILDLSQSELGQIVLNIQRVSLSALIQQCLQDYQPTAEQRSMTLTLDSDLTPPDDGVAVDPHRLRQVMAVLLSNAIKFTPAGGQVTVRLLLNETEVTIQVQDTGIGIAEQHQAIIFRKFKQLDDSYHRQYEGAGIGLALAKQLVELHRGEITCDSTLEVGTLFTVRLPRMPSHSLQRE